MSTHDIDDKILADAAASGLADPDLMDEDDDGQADGLASAVEREEGEVDGPADDDRGPQAEQEAPTLEAYTGDQYYEYDENGQHYCVHGEPSPWNAQWWPKAKAAIFAADAGERVDLMLEQARAVGRAIAGIPNLSKKSKEDLISNAEWLFIPLADYLGIKEIGGRRINSAFTQPIKSALPYQRLEEIPAFLADAGIGIPARTTEPAKKSEDRDDEEEAGSLADPLNPDSEGIVTKLPPPPLDIFTDEIRLVIDKVSETKCIPKEMALSIIIALASACIGRSRGISPRKDWKEHGHLYLMLVAETGSGKSHAFKYIFKDLLKAEAARKAQYKQECRMYAEEMATFRKSKDANKKMPERPVNIQYLLEDSTMEAASERMEDNPKGLFWSLDEMSGFFSSLDKYNRSGNDGVRRLLSAFNAETWNTSRKSKDGMSEERYIAKGSMGIFGGIQPHLLNSLFSYNDVKQGLPQRFLYVRAIVDKPMAFDTPEIPDEVDEIIERVTKRLLSLDMDLDKYGDWQARYLPLEPAARKEFNRFAEILTSNAFGTEANGFAVKLVQITLRLALIIHYLEWASQPAERDCPTVIGYDTMVSTIRLMEWLSSHTEAARQHFPTAKGPRKAKAGAAGGDDRRENIRKFVAEHEEFCRGYHTASELIAAGLKFKGVRQLGMYLGDAKRKFDKKPGEIAEYRLFPLPSGF